VGGIVYISKYTTQRHGDVVLYLLLRLNVIGMDEYDWYGSKCLIRQSDWHEIHKELVGDSYEDKSADYAPGGMRVF
jgi:hypothetical protein